MRNTFLFTAAFLLAFICSSDALALDATGFDPRTVSVEANAISGVPVGTIITWPVAANPDGWNDGKWLECNGQTVNPTVYPELFALVGGQVPDLRGLFLRGTGGNAAALGAVQEDAGRNITGECPVAAEPHMLGGTGALRLIRVGGYRNDGGRQDAVTQVNIDASRVWGAAHVANEFRPRNRTVRYLIRAS